MDDIHFHQSQLNYLEQRASQIQTNIINYYNENQSNPVSLNIPMRSNLYSSPFSRNRRRPRRYREENTREDSKTNEDENQNQETSQEQTQQTVENNHTNQLMSAINNIINNSQNSSTTLSSSFPFLSSASNRVTDSLSPFNYVGTFDIPLNTDNYSNIYPRSFTNRSNNDFLSDSGTLLMYFMLEGLGGNLRNDEQHGINNPSEYIKDFIFKDIENPANTCCPIRMDVFSDDSEITQINKCKHLFCREEIRKWLETHHTCPLCRTAIDN
jgi:hypothetical protein